jgi:hypothetical protein
VSGGAITGAHECLRFTSSSGNVVADTALAGCGVAVRGESPSGPADNTVVGPVTGKVELDEGATLNLAWRVAVTVRDVAGAPVQGAQVQARDATDATAFTAVTDETGAIPPQVVVASSRTGERMQSRLPVTLTVSRTGYAPEVRTLAAPEATPLAISLKPR